MPSNEDKANRDSDINSENYEQELTKMIDEWEEKTRSAQDAIKQTQQQLKGEVQVSEDKALKEDDSIAISEQQIIAETRKKLELLSTDINNMVQARWEKLTECTLQSNP
jgi:PAB1-binding protein PBP1